MPDTDTFDLAILGGGITGLTTAFLALQAQPDIRLVVLEREDVTGGKARTTVRDGYTVDWGPNGFVSSAPHTLDLVRRLGIEADLQPALATAAKRYLYHDGGLRPFPSTPPAFLATEVLSVPGKLRAVLELALGGRHDGEETVYSFLERHFGRGLANALAGSLVAGTTAGDPRLLSVDALFPRLRDMEREHGSLLRAFIGMGRRAARTKRADATGRLEGVRAQAVGTTRPTPGSTPNTAPVGVPADGSPPPGRGRLTSFRAGGMQHLLDTLHQAVGPRVRTGTRVTRLQLAMADTAADGGAPAPHAVEMASGERLLATDVVITTPSHVAAGLLEPQLRSASSALRDIPYSGVRVFGLGFDRIDVPRVLDGFGFLPSPAQGVRSLGVLWSSAIYPGRAPDGKVLLRVLAGGSLDAEMLRLSDDDALAMVLRDLERTMGIVAEPEFREIVTWPHAIPQYTLGHLSRVHAIDDALSAYRGVHLAGNAYRGVSINDSVRDAARTVDRILGV